MLEGKRTAIFHLCLILMLVPVVCFAATPVEQHGALRVEGGRIVGREGKPVVLRGMSLFWSQWMGRFYNSNVVEWLDRDWNCSVVRVAMGVESGGYLTNPTQELDKVHSVVKAAVARGLYVIIDWHDHNADRNASKAQEFFVQMARTYGHLPNVLYETWNEPLKHHGWDEVVRPYHQRMIASIRKEDSDNLILCGTPSWSQDVDKASKNPLTGTNLVYALHFYAGTHRQGLRDKASVALGAGLALMVTEWGTCEASGGGPLDAQETALWLDFMDLHQLSWCNWSVADKRETASALQPGVSAEGGWSTGELTPSGRLVRNILRSKRR